VISVAPWLILIPIGGPQAHVTVGMTPKKLCGVMNNPEAPLYPVPKVKPL